MVSSGLSAFQVMAKPIGPQCNLACRYCFYREKKNWLADSDCWKMPSDILEMYIRQYISQQGAPEINFAWQGGEPTLLSVDYFRRIVALQKKYADGRKIRNALQTNGMLLNDEWCAFLAANGFLVGISVDGPLESHNAYRLDKRGMGTYAQVERSLKLLKKHGVEFNTMTVVHCRNVRKPLELYCFLKQSGSGFMQFIPLVERSEGGISLSAPGQSGQVTDWSVPPEEYGEFLCAIFDEWARYDVGRYYVQLFDVTLGNWVGMPDGLCLFSPICGAALVMEHNGDIYSCDHYVYPEYKLGNLREKTLCDLANSPLQQKFGNDKSAALPQYCRSCDVLFLCHGECPKRRFLRAPDGEPGLNYLCAAYQRFFRYSAPFMRHMRDCLLSDNAVF
jgi:uncharacterized protein